MDIYEIQTDIEGSHKKSIAHNDPFVTSHMTSKEEQIQQNNMKYFEKKLNDRRKRTYEVLS